MKNYTKNYFQTIYEIARRKDEKALKSLLASGVDIDESKPCYSDISAAALHAQEGSRDIANWLLRYGASPKLIATRAARGGDIEYAEYLRKLYRISAYSIAVGAGEGGHFEYAEKLADLFDCNYNFIAIGAARGGHFDYIKNLPKQKFKVDVLLNIAQGAVRGGYVKEAENLRKAFNLNAESICQCAVLSGNMKYAESLYNNNKDCVQVRHVAQWAAKGGHFKCAENLRATFFKSKKSLLHANLYIAAGAIFSGHIKYAEYLMTKPYTEPEFIDEFARTVARFGRMEFLEKIFTEHRISIKQIAIGFAENEHLYSTVLTSLLLSKIQNIDLRTKIANTVKAQKNYNPKYNIDMSLKRANAFVHFRKLYQFDYYQLMLIYQVKDFDKCAIWFLQGKQLMQIMPHFPYELFLFISQSYVGLNAQDTRELDDIFEQCYFIIKQNALINDLMAYTQTKFNFFSSDKFISDQAAQFIHAIKLINNRSELTEWLNTVLISLKNPSIKFTAESTNQVQLREVNPLLDIISRHAGKQSTQQIHLVDVKPMNTL